ncbi:MAG: type II toxin-antitoxin system VapC family toxin [Halolamina sp.]
MSVFVDTGVFYAHHDTDAERHDSAVVAFENLLDGAYGQPYTSGHVFDETVTLTRTRTGSFEAANTVAKRMLGEGRFPDVFEFLGTGEVSDGLETFRRYDDQSLSFTDATTVSLCERHGIDAVLSFDSDFDGLIERVVPEQ